MAILGIPILTLLIVPADRRRPRRRAAAEVGREPRRSTSRSPSRSSSSPPRCRCGSATSRAGPAFQFVENVPWIPGIGASWHLGIDGLSIFLVLLTTALSALAILGSFSAHPRARARLLHAAAGARDRHDRRLRRARPVPLLRLLGSDADPDVPADRRLGRPASASTRRSSSSSTRWSARVLMLVAILWIYFLHYSADRRLHVRPAAALPDERAAAAPRCGCSWRFALAFAIKVPMFPFHTWLPDRARRGADRRLGDPGRRAAEDGHLRLHALRDAAVPRRGARAGARASPCSR